MKEKLVSENLKSEVTYEESKLKSFEKKMVFSRKRQDSPSSDDIIAVLAGKMMKNFLTLLAFPVNDSCRCAAERV